MHPIPSSRHHLDRAQPAVRHSPELGCGLVRDCRKRREGSDRRCNPLHLRNRRSSNRVHPWSHASVATVERPRTERAVGDADFPSVGGRERAMRRLCGAAESSIGLIGHRDTMTSWCDTPGNSHRSGRTCVPHPNIPRPHTPERKPRPLVQTCVSRPNIPRPDTQETGEGATWRSCSSRAPGDEQALPGAGR